MKAFRIQIAHYTLELKPVPLLLAAALILLLLLGRQGLVVGAWDSCADAASSVIQVVQTRASPPGPIRSLLTICIILCAVASTVRQLGG